MAIEHSIVEDPALMYAIGRSRYSVVRKFGNNSAVAASAEAVWSEGGSYSGFVTSAAVASLSSASANDTSAGSGARKVTVYGLDSAWALAEEEVTLSGATPVTTSATFVRVFRLKVTEVGTYGGTNAGKITATVGGSVVAAIPASYGQSQQAVYTVPASHTAYVLQIRVTSEATKPVQFVLNVREAADVTSGSGMGSTRTIFTIAGVAQPLAVMARSYDRIPEKSDVWVECTGTATSASVTAEFDLILVRD